MSEKPTSNKKKGLPLFDKETEMKIAKEAIESGNVAAYCREKGYIVDTVRRYIRKYQRAQAPSAPRDSGPYKPAAGAQYRARPASRDLDRIKQLESENRELLLTIGRQAAELDKIKRGSN